MLLSFPGRLGSARLACHPWLAAFCAFSAALRARAVAHRHGGALALCRLCLHCFLEFIAMADYRIRLRPGDNRPDALWNQIPDDHAVRVGRFMAAYALVEFKLEMIIWHLIGASKHDLRPLTARLDARPKKEAITELLKSRATVQADQRSAWEATKPLLGELTERRSWLAHGIWVPAPLGATSTLLTRKGKAPDIIARMNPITVSDLDQWLSTAALAVENLNKLLPQTHNEQSPSADKR
jgi:hypothetical protein